ncbi:RibD family protein [Xanthobacter sp. DSM 24535]|uniref:RibD family protein n=1 Tax=Roseixanthobacter psychrophilus TaxID=3119917 RepID=UPI00372A5240
MIGQLGQSLDGRIATVSGESKYISGGYALDHLHRLRAAADAVLVGVGTIVADDPLLNVRRVPGTSPARVIVDPSGRLDCSARCLQGDGARRLVLRRAGVATPLPAGVEGVEVASDAEGRMTPQAILAALRAQGLFRILVEGGTRTLSSFLDAGCMDGFHVLVSPVILGSGRPGLELAPIAALKDALRPASRIEVFPDGDVLFACDLRLPAAGGDSRSDVGDGDGRSPDANGTRNHERAASHSLHPTG